MQEWREVFLTYHHAAEGQELFPWWTHIGEMLAEQTSVERRYRECSTTERCTGRLLAIVGVWVWQEK